jgi:hypothetical protein
MGSEVLAFFFPRDAALLRQMGEQASESRVWAGVHFRSDIVAGNAIGRDVTQLMFDRIKNDA